MPLVEGGVELFGGGGGVDVPEEGVNGIGGLVKIVILEEYFD